MARANKHRDQFFNKIVTVSEPKYVRRLLVNAHANVQPSTAAVPAPEPQKSESARNRAVMIGISFGLIAAAVLINLSLVMQREGTLASVRVAGIEVTANATDDELENRLRQKIKNYTLTIKKQDQTLQHFALVKAGITVDAAASVKAAGQVKSGGSLYQKLQWWHTENMELSYTVDETVLRRFIEEQTVQVIEPAQNASISVEGEEMTVIPGKNGQAWTVKEARNQITSAAKSLEPLSLDLTQQVTLPKISTRAVERFKNQIKDVISQSISLQIKDQIHVPTPQDILSWIDIPDFAQVERVELEINSGSVQQYIDTIARPYVEPGKSQIVMADAEGRETVLVRGQNGYDVKNKPEIAATIAEQLTKNQGYNGTLTLADKQFQTINAADYDKWIVVDLTNKHMEAYEGGKMVRSFLVSAGAPKTPTVLGEYRIYAQIRRQDMRGLNVDGSSYFQPNVEFVSYFFEGYAIHGNYWRPNWWFGSVNSSHGCVGVVNPDAEWVYNWASVGTPIITHL